MKNILLVFAVSFLLSPSCNKNQTNGETPLCIMQKVAQMQAEPKSNPPGEVNEYLYKGKRVFLFNAPCCDQYTMLYDASCNYICAPSGGITGRGDGKCTDFDSTAKFVKQIWKDPR